jgi:two-component system, LuxR family, response regulator FixJ
MPRTDMMPTFGRVAIVDDDTSVRRSLADLLIHNGYQVQVFEDAESFLNSLPDVDVLLLDMRMPGLSGVNLQEELKSKSKYNNIVFISGDSHPEEIIKAMKQGAIDFLLKPFTAQTVLDVLTKAMSQSAAALSQLQRHDQIMGLLKRLTPREVEVCHWMVRGYSNQQISVFDGAAASTIKLHRARVMEKMEVSSLPELIDLLSGVDVASLIKPRLELSSTPLPD